MRSILLITEERIAIAGPEAGDTGGRYRGYQRDPDEVDYIIPVMMMIERLN